MSLTRAGGCGSNVRSVFPVAGSIVAMLTNRYASLRVPKLTPGDAELRTLGVGEIHVLPRDVVGRERSPSQRLADRPDEGPRRQPVDECRRSHQKCVDETRLVLALDLEFLDAAHLLPIHVADFPAEQQLGVDLDHSSSSLPPPGMRSITCLAIHSSQSSAPVSLAR